MGLRFYLVDVFTEQKYAGNQLCVCLNDQAISTQQMQHIAKEINFSETTFIDPIINEDGSYNVRIFTPNAEIPFAGHPTLGSAHIIRRYLQSTVGKSVNLNLAVGNIVVQAEADNYLWMQQKKPLFGDIIEAKCFADFLNLSLDDINTQFPIQAVSTGLPFFIVPLKTKTALNSAKMNVTAFFNWLAQRDQSKPSINAKAVLIFCPETDSIDNNLSVRVFVDYYGIAEDPATGSANGCLAGYLVEHQYFNQPSIDIRIEQGYAINRPSLLFAKAEKNNNIINIFIGGKTIDIGQGEFII